MSRWNPAATPWRPFAALTVVVSRAEAYGWNGAQHVLVYTGHRCRKRRNINENIMLKTRTHGPIR